IVAGSMIGSGIFVVSTYMSRDLGSSGYLLLAWFLTGLITVFAALSYGELAGMMPKAGGQYVYLQRAYGKTISFLYGWTVFSVIQTGVIAAVAVTFANYSSVFIPALNKTLLAYHHHVQDGKFIFPLPENGLYFMPDDITASCANFRITFGQLFAIGSVIFLTFLNSLGVKNGKTIQTVFTSAKILALLALIVLGISAGWKTGTLSQNFADAWNASYTKVDPETNKVISVESITGWALVGALAATMINSLFSSDAWNNVTFIAGEIKQPEKNIPRSLFLGTLIVTLLYILANIAYLSLLPLHGSSGASDIIGKGMQFQDNDRIGAAAANMIFGNSAVFIMAALIMISTFGCNNGIILSGARLYYAMAKDGLFFKRAARLNSFSVPAFALWIQCAWGSLLCLSGRYGQLLTYSTFASLLFYILTIAGIFILRRKEPGADRPYKAFGYPVIPALYIVTVTAICVTLLVYDPLDTGIGLGIVLLGLPIYYITRSAQAPAPGANNPQ
ncbi:MAG TPA: amino acid permease, partial [Bacteroidia bacterium]